MDIVDTAAASRLRSFVERVERMNEEIAAANADKAEIFKEVESQGFDKAAVKRVIAYRKKDADQAEADELLFDTYLRAVEGKSADGTKTATSSSTITRAGARAERADA
jgi:uncharacterized protein (UPF0335 family)